MSESVTDHKGQSVPLDGKCICDPKGNKPLRMCPLHGILAEERDAENPRTTHERNP